MSAEDEQHFLTLVRENQELKNQVAMLAEQLEMSAQRLEQLTALMSGDESRRRREGEEAKNTGRITELEMKLQEAEKRLL
jgi:predicted RNase H-like nuclease (RuvC/YqgF family)